MYLRAVFQDLKLSFAFEGETKEQIEAKISQAYPDKRKQARILVDGHASDLVLKETKKKIKKEMTEKRAEAARIKKIALLEKKAKQ